MHPADEVRGHLNSLHEAVWELAAMAVALNDPVNDRSRPATGGRARPSRGGPDGFVP
jgi:hypothetical protein